MAAPPLAREDQARVERFAALLLRYPPQDVERVLPLLYLAVAQSMDRSEVPADVLQTIGEFAISLGLGPSADPATVEAEIEAHYRAHPPNGELLSELKRAAREEVASKLTAGRPSPNLARILGEAAALLKAPRQPPPPGAVASGPLARFALGAPSPGPTKRPRKK